MFSVVWLLVCFAFFAEAGLLPPEAKSTDVQVGELIVTDEGGGVWTVTHGAAQIEITAPESVTSASPSWAKMVESVAKEFSKEISVENASERRRYEQTRNAFLATASFPLMLLILGFVARWVIGGFRQT